MQTGTKICHLLLNQSMFSCLFLKLLLHLVKSLHHFIFLLGFGITLSFLLLQLLLEFVMVCKSEAKKIKGRVFKLILAPENCSQPQGYRPFRIFSACSFHCFTSFSLTSLKMVKLGSHFRKTLADIKYVYNV